MTAWDDNDLMSPTIHVEQIEAPEAVEPMDLDEDRIAALWRAAAQLVADVAEQAWIVSHAVAAGWSAEQLLGTAHARWCQRVNGGRPAGTLEIERVNGGGW